MKQYPTYGGDNFHSVASRAIDSAPCWFDFNGIRVEVPEDMKGRKEEAKKFLYEYYSAGLSKKPLPVWKQSEKPCKQCGRNCFPTDKKCWWCETKNPCT